MNTLALRLISAIVAVALLALLTVGLGALGLQLFIFLAVVLGARELAALLFHDESFALAKGAFFVSVSTLYLLNFLLFEHTDLIFSVIVLAYFASTLHLRKKFADLESLLLFQAKTVLGLFYLGLLPTFASRMVQLPGGIKIFFSFLTIVFCGDIFAYFVGTKLGKHYIIPEISPKKTVEGALGGVFGSLLAGFLLCFLYLNKPLIPFLILTIGTALVAQAGDFFESLMKRAANIKDSGSIMPGHGGVLDRIDGALFAAPFFLLGVLYLDGLL